MSTAVSKFISDERMCVCRYTPSSLTGSESLECTQSCPRLSEDIEPRPKSWAEDIGVPTTLALVKPHPKPLSLLHGLNL